MKTTRKVLSWLLALCAVLSFASASALAAGGDNAAGDDATGGTQAAPEPTPAEVMAASKENGTRDAYVFTVYPETGFTIPANGSYTIHWATNFTPVKLAIKKMVYAASIVNPNDPPVLISEATLVELSGSVTSYPLPWDPDFNDGSSMGCVYQLWAYYSANEHITFQFSGISEKPVFTLQPSGGFTIPCNGTHRISWSTNFTPVKCKIMYSVYVASIVDPNDPPILWDQKTIAEFTNNRTYYDLPWDPDFSGHSSGKYTLYVYYNDSASGSIYCEFTGSSEQRAFTSAPPQTFDIPINGSYQISWDTNFAATKYVIDYDEYVYSITDGTPVHWYEEKVAELAETQKNYTLDWVHPDSVGQSGSGYGVYTLTAYDSDNSVSYQFYGLYERPKFTTRPSGPALTMYTPAAMSWATNFTSTKVELCMAIYEGGGYQYEVIRTLPGGTTSCQLSYDEIKDFSPLYNYRFAIRVYYGSGARDFVEYFSSINLVNTAGICGYDGDNLTWSLDESSGTLTISGEGRMADFTSADTPWMSFRSKIRTVTVEEGVTSVGGHAFQDSPNIAAVNLPSTLESIGDYAFRGCSKLTSFTVPEGVTTIGSYTFYNCTGLTTVDLPSTLSSIGDWAFTGCNALADAYINMSQQEFDTNVTWVKSKNSGLLYAAKHFTFVAAGQAGPNLTWKLEDNGNLRFLGSGAMYNWSSSDPAPWYDYRDSITSISTNNAKTIGDYAFRDCSKLTSFSVGAGMTYLGANAFQGCSGMSSFTWNAVYSTEVDIPAYCFQGCSSLKSISIPTLCTQIGDHAFDGCRALTTVSFPNGSTSTLTGIGSYVFYDCRSLTSFPLPSSLTSLGEYCFYGCTGITGTLAIPNGITVIPSFCFQNCSGIQELTVGTQVTKISSMAFNGCTRLTRVNYDGFRSQWRKITVDLSNTPLLNASFSWLYRSGTLSGDGVYWRLSGGSGQLDLWGSGAMPNWVGTPEAAPWYEFRDYIETINVYSGVTQIGSYAFSGYEAIKTVYLPDSVTRVCGGAFVNCSSLADVWYDALEAVRQEKLSIDTPNGALLNAQWHYSDIGGSVYGPHGGIDLSWSLDDAGVLRIYWDEDTMDMGYMEIPDYEDYRETPWYQYGAGEGQLIPLIKAVQVDELVTRIGDYAFSRLTEVTDVQIASTVTSIGDGAFDGCSSLISIEIPDTVETMEDSVFWNCGSLEIVKLPAGLTEIPYGTFYACSNLYKVYLPGTVTSIEQYAFSGCEGLTYIYFDGTSAQWGAIDLYNGNDPVNSAKIHFNPPEIAIDADEFPDPAFRAYVAQYIDQDGSGWLDDDELQEAINIYASELGIESLDGIENFPRLIHLDVSGNAIGGTLDLRGNPMLQSVNVGGNELYTLILTDLTDLTTLICAGNDDGMSAPDLSTNTALVYLDCSGCDGMEDLDLSANTALTDLDCSWNQIEALDLSANTALQQLNCSHNNLSELDLSTCIDLRQANCMANVLITLTLGQQPQLITLTCYANELSTLDLSGSSILRTAVITGTRAEKMNLNWYDYPYVEYSKGANYLQADKSTALRLGSYALSGFEASATGMSYYSTVGGYWLDGRAQTPVWKDDIAPDFAALSSYNITVGLNEACTEKVTREPLPGGTCYVSYSIFLSDLGKGNVNFSELNTSNCTLNLDGYSSECINVKTVVSGGKDVGVVLFKVVKDMPDTYTVTGVEATGTGVSYNNSVHGYTMGTVTVNPSWLYDYIPDSAAYTKVATGLRFNEDLTGGYLQTEPEPGVDYYVGVGVHNRDTAACVIDITDDGPAPRTLTVPGYTTEYVKTLRVPSDSGYESLYYVFRITGPDGILPAAMRTIEEEALAGCAFRSVRIPDGAVEIGARAFAGSPNLAYVYIPASVTTIASDAFDGVPAGLTIIGAASSVAETFAAACGYAFIVG